MTQYFYRYDDEWFENDTEPHIRLWQFPVVRTTKCCVFIHVWGRERRVMLDARATFAKPTIAEAKESFRIRKRYAANYAEMRKSRALACLEKLDDPAAWDRIDQKPATSGRAP